MAGSFWKFSNNDQPWHSLNTLTKWRVSHVLSKLTCGADVLLERVEGYKLAIAFLTGHLWFRVRVNGGGRRRGRGRGKARGPTPPVFLLMTVAHLLGPIFFLYPAFRYCLNQRWQLCYSPGKCSALARQNCACSAGYSQRAYIEFKVEGFICVQSEKEKDLNN